jgi:hypothetical protein
LPGASFSHIVEPKEVHFTPEQEARIATNAGTDAERW